jgi:hypothetical protein
VLFSLLNHPVGHHLSQKILPLKIYIHYSVEAFLRRFEKVQPFRWCNACIIYKHIASAELVFNRFYKCFTVSFAADIGPQYKTTGA